MKTVCTFLIIILLSACSKDCKQCTRTWTYKAYRQYNNGPQYQFTYPPSTEDIFQACGDAEIEQAEKTQTTHKYNPPYRDGWVDATGTCHCN